ncbi:hypothetical protein [Synechococcus sp. PCC 7336]|uniref:hypothetical protein n=1 Tax=Synechococcus sp. PCC 7336 TaxID=195250 RepID=UPI00034904B6|nr:hypothetical protein [Synechococcus sp. PCC 7336]
MRSSCSLLQLTLSVCALPAMGALLAFEQFQGVLSAVEGAGDLLWQEQRLPVLNGDRAIDLDTP